MHKILYRIKLKMIFLSTPERRSTAAQKLYMLGKCKAGKVREVSPFRLIPD